MTTLTIPAALQKNVTDEWGADGAAWLKRLPELLMQCQQLWDIEVQPSPFELSHNYVTTVKLQSGSKAILKVGYPQTELFNEIKVLRLLQGNYTAQLLQSDEDIGALLLEKIEPGTVLTTIQRNDDEKATLIATQVLGKLPIPVPGGMKFPTVGDWGKAFQRVREIKGNPLSPIVLDKAERLLAELEASKDNRMLLHGDLHHDNILLDEQRGWLSIDPKGVVGDPLFNAARFLNNPRPRLIAMDNARKVIERRLELISSAFEADISRLAAWAFVDCILSACWWIESGGRTCNFSLAHAEIFDLFL